MEKIIKNIDWKLLREQKITLIALVPVLAEKYADHLQGVLGLIDSIQDYAVDELGLNEDDVFNLNKD